MNGLFCLNAKDGLVINNIKIKCWRGDDWRSVYLVQSTTTRCRYGISISGGMLGTSAIQIILRAAAKNETGIPDPFGAKKAPGAKFKSKT